MRLALCVLFALASCRKPAPAVSHDAVAPSAPNPTGAAPASAPAEVDLTKDVPVAVAGGVTLALVTTLEAHVTDKAGQSRNEFTCQLKATKAGESREVTLTRLSPDPGPEADVFGLKLSLIMVDAYHDPTTAVVRVAP